MVCSFLQPDEGQLDVKHLGHHRPARSLIFTMQLRSPLFVALTLSLCFAAAHAQTVPPKLNQEVKTDERVTGHVLILEKLPPPTADKLKVPDGFKLERFAENLGHARLLAVAPSGDVYLTRRDQADVLLLKVGANGLSAGEPTRVASRPGLHGIAFHDGKVYLATTKEIFTGDVLPDGKFGPLKMIIHDLPDAGQHPTRTIRVGPDNMLYIGVASTTKMQWNPTPSPRQFCARRSMGSPALFLPRVSAIRSVGAGIRSRANFGKWIMASTGLATTSRRKS